MVNEYEPWKSHGMTELEYYKHMFIEECKRTKQLELALIARADHYRCPCCDIDLEKNRLGEHLEYCDHYEIEQQLNAEFYDTDRV